MLTPLSPLSWLTLPSVAMVSWLALSQPALSRPAFSQPPLILAQAITPATDGTGTTVNSVGNQVDISGGTTAGNNLFHSFQTFDVNLGQTANFVANPTLENILGRITGGQPSSINGTLQITGATANLFLINPAGLIFGPNAQLNLPAAFLGMTGDRIAFGDQWFNAFGPNNYAQLLGDPTAFAFSFEDPAALVNQATLAVRPGNTLILLGGNINGGGNLTAPGGNLLIAAVPGQNRVQISQAGAVLTLEISTLAGGDRLPPELTPQSLPQFLTGTDSSIQVGNLSTAVNDTTEEAANFIQGGPISVAAPQGTIAAGAIDTSARSNSTDNVAAGAVQLNGGRDIQFETINTASQGESRDAGQGGNVSINAAGTIQGTGTLLNELGSPTTIDTFGGETAGTIALQHNGGPDNVGFTVGNLAINGTAGGLSVGTFGAPVAIANTSFNATGTTTQGPNNEISITFNNAAPILTGSPGLTTTVDQPLSFTLNDLNLAIADADNDNLTLALVAVNSGILRRNGVVLGNGEAIALTDALTYEPPTGISGNLNAFSLRVSDGLAVSQTVEVPTQIDNPPDPPSPPRIPPGIIRDLQTQPESVLKVPETVNQSVSVIFGIPLESSARFADLSIFKSVIPEPNLLLIPPTYWSTKTIQSLQGNVFGNNPDTSNKIPTSLSVNTNGPNTLPFLGPGGSFTVTVIPMVIGVQPLFPSLPLGIGPMNTVTYSIQISPTGDAEVIDPAASGVNSLNPGVAGAPISPSNPDLGPIANVPQDDSLNPSQNNSNPGPETISGVTPTRIPFQDCPQQVKQLQETSAGQRDQGLYNVLIQCYEQNLSLAEANKSSEWELYSLNNLGVSHFVIGDYLKALEFHQTQLEKAMRTSDRTQIGIAQAGIGAAYAALGDYDTAIDYYNRSLNQLTPETAPQWYTLALRNLGNAYLSKKNYPQAIQYQRQSLTLVRATQDRYGEMQTLGNLGNTYALNGEFGQAIAHYQQSLTLAQAIGSQLEIAQTLLGLGATYAYQKDYGKAIEFNQQALAIVRDLKTRLGEGIALTNLGDAQFQVDQLAAAERSLFESLSVWESLRAGLGNNDTYKVSIFETQLAAYQNLQEVLVDQNKPAQALEIAERGRGRAFVELLARGNAAQQSQKATVPPPNLAELQRIAREQKATMVAYTIAREQFVEVPHGASPQYAGEPQASRLLIWVLSPEGNVQVRQVNLFAWQQQNKTSLVNAVAIARRCMNDRLCARAASRLSRGEEGAGLVPSGAAASTAASMAAPAAAIAANPLNQLYQLLITPIADLLPPEAQERIVFIPQEELFLVPFPALQANDGSYLVRATYPPNCSSDASSRGHPPSPPANPQYAATVPDCRQSDPYAAILCAAAVYRDGSRRNWRNSQDSSAHRCRSDRGQRQTATVPVSADSFGNPWGVQFQ